ncbi:hypothetical protein GK047_06650 [Paenibacillus sp. SYP-B3998]|uniref:ATPase BadF/BadG/BcrA/BcrD type domain-containing protein n=1 Tax=Paenibacillus sp. SYP-B3998 TaxID=2678564 RepID=A0A6G3ZVS8_9BACL|nr:BadF/BadG/BcrA/BcrD ATPase family protein [Paenibacillus sp. SYP-B3998]NEW05699.1 hypothetical protein [Paenibacillus sp. SYP-B3998]
MKPRHQSGKKLYEIADIVIDNCGCVGDAAVYMEQMDISVGPTSTVIGAYILIGGRPGVVVISGTGSIAYSLSPDHTVRMCGGFGPLFGDEGSGYFIGTEALRAVSMDFDKRGTQTLLTRELGQVLGFRNQLELIDKVYESMSRKDIAALAAHVAYCAAQNDKVSLHILEDAGKHLAEHMLTLIHQTNWKDRLILSYAGGVFGMGELIIRPLMMYLGEWSEFLCAPCNKPSYGAAMLARKALKSIRP